MIELRSWNSIKSFFTSRNIGLHYIEDDNFYYIFSVDSNISVSYKMEKDGSDTAGINDFETNYKPVANVPLSTIDGVKTANSETSRPPILTDDVNINLYYKGYALKHTTLKSDPEWLIERYIKQGNSSKISYASTLKDKIWNNRSTYNYDNENPGQGNNDSLSVLFDGINDYLVAVDAFNYEHTQQFSVSIWIKPNNFAVTRYFIGNVDTSGNVYGWRIGHDTAGKILVQTRSNGGAYAPTIFTDAQLVAGQWNHVVFKWLGGSNNNQSRIYVNGLLSSIAPAIGSLTTSWLASNQLEIGRAAGNYFSGNIFGASLWNIALDDYQVSTLFNAGDPVDPLTVEFASNNKNNYKLGTNDSFPQCSNSAGNYDNLTCTNMVDANTNFVVDAP